MKKLLSLLLMMVSTFINAQNYKDWKTNAFQEGDTILIPNNIIDSLGYHRWNELNPRVYKYIADFLNYHTEIKSIKILNYTEHRGSDKANLAFSQRRAQSMVFHLTPNKLGIEMSSEGLGETLPSFIIDSLGQKQKLTKEYILSASTDEEKEILHRINGRYEIVVLESDTTQLQKRINSDIRFTHPKDGGIFKITKIRYDFAKWYLQKNDSVNSVDSLKILAEFMKEYPNIVVEIMVHTDCRGSNKSSFRLSPKRAQSVVDCLIQYYGIEKDRLVAKGYGETEPKTVLDGNGNRVVLTCQFINSFPTKDEQERMHQMNRRTEFQILSWDYMVRD